MEGFHKDRTSPSPELGYLLTDCSLLQEVVSVSGLREYAESNSILQLQYYITTINFHYFIGLRFNCRINY